MKYTVIQLVELETGSVKLIEHGKFNDLLLAHKCLDVLCEGAPNDDSPGDLFIVENES